jgi:type I restriction enzyme M protein
MIGENSSPSNIWKFFRPVWDESGLPDRDLPIILAALIYLRWADFQEAELEAIAAFDDTDYEPALPAGLHWRTWYELSPQEQQRFFDNRLSAALERLNNSRKNNLATHLHHIAPAVRKLGKVSPHSLGTMIHWLAEQPFETPTDRRAMLDMFDIVLEKTLHKHTHEFRTPDSVVRLMVALAAPVFGDRIYDPCFGSAGLLTGACDYVMKTEKDRFSRSGAPLLNVYGVELNQDTYLIALIRLALAGIDNPNLELGSSLERQVSGNSQRDGFDVVLADPPWGMRVNPAGLDHFPINTTDVTGLFIQHALSQLRPEGRAVIVVPQGFLFRSGPEQRLRRLLLEQHEVEAIVALPETTFLPYTAIRASLLVLRRNGPTKRIRMADAEPLFTKSKGKRPAVLHDEKIEEFCRSLRMPKADQYCWDVEVDSLAEVDWDFTPKRRDQSGLIGVMTSLRSEIDVVPLKTCCLILSGRAVKSDELIDEPPVRLSPGQTSLFPERQVMQKSLFETPVIPYIRIQDIRQGQATKGSSWLTREAASSVDAKAKLKTGDVLLSKSGTIGKAGVVRNGGVGAVAANGFFILRPDLNRLDPQFLLVYLTSRECRSWLDERARGATIRHLSKHILDEMPVPLPPLQIQQRVATQHREHGTDVLANLLQLLIEGEDDPIAEWVDAALQYLESVKNVGTKENDVTPLMHSQLLGDKFTEIRNRSAHQDISQNPLAPWIIALADVADALRNSDETPPGPAFYSLLQQAAHALHRAEALITGHLPTENKARELARVMADRIEKAMTALADDIRIIISCATIALPPGKMASLDIIFKNESALPLRNVRVLTQPSWGGGKIGYLAEQASKSIAVSGVTPKEAGKYSLQVIWSGVTLDGEPIAGESEIAFNLIEPETIERVEVPGLGGSPYVCGDALKPERDDVFFGREELLEQIRRQIIQTGNVVLLEGNRRSGKSSILFHLEGAKAIPGWLGVYCSLQGAEGNRERLGVATVEVFREIAKSIAKAMYSLGGDMPLPNGKVLSPGKKLGIAKAVREGIEAESPFSDFRDYVEIVLEQLKKNDLGMLLLLDEFDKLQEGIDSGITSPQVPENIRFLVQTYPRFSAILTGSKRLKRLREEYWSALYGIGTRFGVTALPEEASRRLITEPVRNRLTYTSEAVEQVIYLTAGQPYLLQCLCNRIFDMAAQLKIRSVTLDLANQASHALVEDNEHFASLWDYAKTARRHFILTLCYKKASGPDPLQLGVIQEHLLTHGIEIDDEKLIADLEFLRELELIELVGNVSGGYYKLAIPLMGIWIEKQQDFAVVLSKAKMETEDQHE